MEDADASLLVGDGEVRRCKEGIRVEGWIIGRHYCPAPIATWIHSGQNAPEGPSSEAKLLLYYFTDKSVKNDR